MDEIGQSYLTLALALDRHVPGLVDAYFGPAELQAEAQAGEPRSLAELVNRTYQLQAAIKLADYDPHRCRSVEKLTTKASLSGAE